MPGNAEIPLAEPGAAEQEGDHRTEHGEHLPARDLDVCKTEKYFAMREPEQGRGSEMFNTGSIFFHPGSGTGSGSATKNLNIFNRKK